MRRFAGTAQHFPESHTDRLTTDVVDRLAGCPKYAWVGRGHAEFDGPLGIADGPTRRRGRRSLVAVVGDDHGEGPTERARRDDPQQE